MQASPVFTFANQAGLDMLETTLAALQDITLEKIFDDHGKRNLSSEFPQIMQQVSSLNLYNLQHRFIVLDKTKYVCYYWDHELQEKNRFFWNQENNLIFFINDKNITLCVICWMLFCSPPLLYLFMFIKWMGNLSLLSVLCPGFIIWTLIMSDLCLFSWCLFIWPGLCLPSRWNMLVKHGETGFLWKSSSLESAEWRWKCSVHLLYVYKLVVCLTIWINASKL